MTIYLGAVFIFLTAHCIELPEKYPTVKTPENIKNGTLTLELSGEVTGHIIEGVNVRVSHTIPVLGNLEIMENQNTFVKITFGEREMSSILDYFLKIIIFPYKLFLRMNGAPHYFLERSYNPVLVNPERQ